MLVTSYNYYRRISCEYICYKCMCTHTLPWHLSRECCWFCLWDGGSSTWPTRYVTGFAVRTRVIKLENGAYDVVDLCRPLLPF